jgi:hypothetical protein
VARFADLRYFLPQLCDALLDGLRHGDRVTSFTASRETASARCSASSTVVAAHVAGRD